MRRRSASCAAGLIGLAASCPALALADQAAIIVDETCWFRRYCVFGPNRYSAAALRAEGPKVLGQAGLDRLKRDTERLLAKRGINPAGSDLLDHVEQPMYEDFVGVPAPPPPENWTATDFDDGTWVRQRRPFQGGVQADITNPTLGQFDETMDLGAQRVYHHARFVVDSPDRAGPVTLRLVYSGGARAYVNGKEVARGNLPAGELASDAAADFNGDGALDLAVALTGGQVVCYYNDALGKSVLRVGLTRRAGPDYGQPVGRRSGLRVPWRAAGGAVARPRLAGLAFPRCLRASVEPTGQGAARPGDPGFGRSARPLPGRLDRRVGGAAWDLRGAKQRPPGVARRPL